jgi:hypothetical protein
MRYEVPQFIDIQDKIFGPLTFKQFIYIAGGAGLCYVVYRVLPIYFAVPIMLAIAALAWALSFYKLNNQPFINIGQAFLAYITKNKVYVWKKELKKAEPIKTIQVVTPTQNQPDKDITARRISDLARNLDILDKTRYN